MADAATGRIVAINGMGAISLGYEPGELIGQFADVLAPGPGAWLDRIRILLGECDEYVGVRELKRKDGSACWARGHVYLNRESGSIMIAFRPGRACQQVVAEQIVPLALMVLPWLELILDYA